MFKRLRTFIRITHGSALDLAEDLGGCLKDNLKDLVQGSKNFFQKDVDSSKRTSYAMQIGECLLVLPLLIIACAIIVVGSGITEAFAT